MKDVVLDTEGTDLSVKDGHRIVEIKMAPKKLKKTMEFKSATVGILSFFEKIIRSHPLIYIFIRSVVRFTNIFEKDFDGIKLLKFKKKINIIDVGASDGVAVKYFNNNYIFIINIFSIIINSRDFYIKSFVYIFRFIKSCRRSTPTA